MFINEAFSNLTIVDIDRTFVDGIKTGEATEQFVRNLGEITKQLALEAAETEEINSKTIIVETPRGGSWPSAVVAILEEYADAQLATANLGQNRDKEAGAIANNFPIGDHYIIPDGIMATGTTMKQAVEAIQQRCLENGIKPKFTLLCPLVSQIGLDQKENFFSWAKGEGIEVEVITAGIEEAGGYVEFTENGPQLLKAQTSNSVLIVGEMYTNNEGRITGMEIGDYGDMFAATQSTIIPGMFGLK